METKILLCVTHPDFENVNKLRTDGWQLDPAFKGAVILTTENFVVYHLVKYTAEELQAIAQTAELATQQPPLDIADFVALPVEATKAEPGSDSLIKKYLDAGYIVDVSEKIAAKSTKTVNLYKPKPKPEAPAQAIPIKIEVQLQTPELTPETTQP